MSGAPEQDLPEDFLQRINAHMHQGHCPSAGCLGECFAIDYQTQCQDGTYLFTAYLSIWDAAFSDPGRVAQWFHDLGARQVRVLHVLHDELNDDRNGRSEDGARQWQVEFYMPPEALAA